MKKIYLLSNFFISFTSVSFILGNLVFPNISIYAKSNALSENIPGQYIVVMKDSSNNENTIGEFTKAHNLFSKKIFKNTVKGFSSKLTSKELKAVKEDPRVSFVTEDKVIHPIGWKVNGILSTQSVNTKRPTNQVLPNGINRIDAENKNNKGKGIGVAVIDTGIDLNHPDLKYNIAGGINCSTATTGYTDEYGHGTHVAGIIAASNNTEGVVGVASNVSLYSARVFDGNGAGSWSNVICALDYVASNAGLIKVVNMSLIGGGTSDDNCGYTNNDVLHQAICKVRDAGVIIVVGAGNSSSDITNFVPASYNDAVITVSALVDTDGMPKGLGAVSGSGSDDTFATFSNYGGSIDLAAPGVDIYSTTLGGGYGYMSGTSMSTPHVTGSVALYLKKYPGSNWLAVRDGLISLGESLGSGHTDPSGLHMEKVVKVNKL